MKKLSRAATNLGVRIGANIVRLRTGKKLRQDQLAAQAGINKSYLSQIEAGQRLPSLPMLLKIAEGLGIEARDLIS